YFYVFVGDLYRGPIFQPIFLLQLTQGFALFPLFVGMKARLLEFVPGDGVFHSLQAVPYALPRFSNILVRFILMHPHASYGFINEVDGRLRQLTSTDITAGVQDRM